MNELDAYTSLIIMGGLAMSLPFFYRVCYSLGKLIVIKFFPPKYLSLEVQSVDGATKLKRIKINDNKVLTAAILQSTGRELQ